MLANSVVPIAKAPSDIARITRRSRPGDSGAEDVGVDGPDVGEPGAGERGAGEGMGCEVKTAPARGSGGIRCRRWKR
ncbi:hypothetical protein GCM10023160_33830 [Brachybacterium paraconglomeratum]